MFEIIALVLLSIHIHKLANRKGLSGRSWVGLTVLCWLGFEFLGVGFGIVALKIDNLVNLAILGLASGFGGYLLIRFILENKPDKNDDEDINSIGRL